MSTGIEWTDETWNPLAAFDRETGERGWFCTKVSPGCKHCYAEALNKRWGTGHAYTVPNLKKIEFRLVNLDRPLGHQENKRIFVNSMTDLFHEEVPDELILKIFAVMAQAREWAKPETRHTYQILTKRPGRMRDFMSRISWKWGQQMGGPWRMEELGNRPLNPIPVLDGDGDPTPPPNIWFGTSVEDQARADERIPILQHTPAAVRFLSCEPLLGDIDLGYHGAGAFWLDPHGERMRPQPWSRPEIDWVIVGGESGPSARPMHIDWAAWIVAQCQYADVPVFVKQLGGNPVTRESPLHPDRVPVRDLDLEDAKGGDPEEWPQLLRVREFPATQDAPA